MSSMWASVKRPQRFNDRPDVLISISAAASEKERVDFFRKLGYSPAEVMATLSKPGLSTDTNSMLGELVWSRTRTSSDKNQKYQPPPTCWTPGTHRDRKCEEAELRLIVIDGSNVAMSHGNKEVFSCRGIQLAVNFFRDRGHKKITVFVPAWRKEQSRPDAPITDKNILMKLEKQKTLVFTPSRRIGGRRVVCYDDRFIVKLAHESGGVIVSNDTYRNLQGEKPEWKKCIEERLLMYSFVNDKFMPPDDPLGRHGPSLENFLRTNPLPAEQRRQLCPYDKKCTYGIKCKYYHPERANQSQLSLADELREKAQVSSSKEERNARLSPKQLLPGTGPVRTSCPLSRESDTGHKSSSPVNTVSENKLLFEGDPRSSPGHVTCPVAVQCQNEWSRLHSVPSHYYTSVRQGYLDLGLGSYDSQFMHTGPLSVPVYFEHKTSSYFCGCGAPSRTPWGNTEGDGQVHCLVFPPRQQSYWPDPFQALHPTRTCVSLPTAQPPQQHHSRHCSSANWPHNWQHIPAAPDPQKLELQEKLQAIFNPQQVEMIMEMFPHVKDMQNLAAEIFNLKAQRGVF